jgi:hypothetical protein
MFNLIVKGVGWVDGRDVFPSSRTFEMTAQPLVERFRPNGQLDTAQLMTLPTLFVEEGRGNEIAHIGRIDRIREEGADLVLDFTYDAQVPGITNRQLIANRHDFGIGEWELNRTHWAMKDENLFRALLRQAQPRRQHPRVFQIPEHENIERQLVSAMMPFAAQFNDVYATLRDASEAAGLRCRRADDIWENPAVIQDVVSLIDRSHVVIADCTGRNPNVFYEIGIAHTLGREVVLITQHEADIPFDLRHLRFLTYLNNAEGRAALAARLTQRLEDLA